MIFICSYQFILISYEVVEQAFLRIKANSNKIIKCKMFLNIYILLSSH